MDFTEQRDLRNTIDALHVTDDVLRLRKVSQEQLDNWVRNATDSTGVRFYAPSDAVVIGMICLQQARIEDATKILVPLADTNPATLQALGRDAWSRKDWGDAATYYDQFQQMSRDRIESIYLSGLALSRSGKSEAGDAKMAKALRIGFQPVSHLRLAMELLKVNETELAKEFLRKVVRLATHHSLSHLEAIWYLKANASTPQELAMWCQQWQLVQSRYNYGDCEQSDFLQVPLMLHSALAEQALLRKDWQQVDAELEVCRAANDGDTTFYRQWVERLNMAGRTDLAKAWEQKVSLTLDQSK